MRYNYTETRLNWASKKQARLISNATKAEKRFEYILKELGVNYEFQKTLLTEESFIIVDFVVGNYVFEIDGFSHNSLEQKVSDRKRDDFLHKEGYTVMRVRNEQIESSRLELIEYLKGIFSKSNIRKSHIKAEKAALMPINESKRSLSAQEKRRIREFCSAAMLKPPRNDKTPREWAELMGFEVCAETKGKLLVKYKDRTACYYKRKQWTAGLGLDGRGLNWFIAHLQYWKMQN